ncbi:hypothetical protein AMJ48_01095 [Parcubacteria bacterium DG_74_1]|nr:MAG: hypothetical protein AMJ48_01095 [Parcubacteria bacterium DG_74_1]
MPIALLIFLLFILFLPILLALAYFHIITLSFEGLGISSGVTIFLLFLILIGSCINIPLTRKKLVYSTRARFFGLFRVPQVEIQGVAINLGGGLLPILLSFYFLFLLWKQGVELAPVLVAVFFMIILTKFLARVVPGRGITLPFFIPPIFSAIFALILAPEFAAPTAFVAGVLGTLIGADMLNLRKARKYGGYLSIGGAGVFDGIFLVGIVSTLLVG